MSWLPLWLAWMGWGFTLPMVVVYVGFVFTCSRWAEWIVTRAYLCEEADEKAEVRRFLDWVIYQRGIASARWEGKANMEGEVFKYELELKTTGLPDVSDAPDNGRAVDAGKD